MARISECVTGNKLEMKEEAEKSEREHKHIGKYNLMMQAVAVEALCCHM